MVAFEDLPTVTFEAKTAILAESAWDGRPIKSNQDEEEDKKSGSGSEQSHEGPARMKRRKVAKRGAKALMRRPSQDQEVPAFHHPTPPLLALEFFHILDGEWAVLGTPEAGVISTALAHHDISNILLARNPAHADFLRTQTKANTSERLASNDFVFQKRLGKLEAADSSDTSESGSSKSSNSKKDKTKGKGSDKEKSNEKKEKKEKKVKKEKKETKEKKEDNKTPEKEKKKKDEEKTEKKRKDHDKEKGKEKTPEKKNKERRSSMMALTSSSLIVQFCPLRQSPVVCVVTMSPHTLPLCDSSSGQSWEQHRRSCLMASKSARMRWSLNSLTTPSTADFL